MAAPDIVKELVERFRDNLESYRSAQFNEAQLRQELLNPLFKALGWDVYNEQGHAEAYKDVIHEDAIKIGTESKAPDYCFRIGGRRIFFLEAKKPAVNVGQDVSAAYQLRRYAWSAKLPLSILSDFEEFAVYDCRVRPDKKDKPTVARTMFLSFEDYLEKWDEIAGIFSREAVLKGSFDKYAEDKKRKRGTAEVDAAFLGEIESWRESIAKNFALRNKDLSQRDLNFAVQRTIDRIVFLRMCEDRGIEKYGQLAGISNGEQIYRRLCQLFDRADERYNSGLFHYQEEKGRAEPPDELTQSLVVDDKPLKEILKSLYYPDSPYEFSVLPAEILGQVYEQFLGKVIRLTKGHQAKVEDKPEVKKAGGVYYTPAYIVDYIVQNTVGKLVEKKTPRTVSKLRVLDPACGSGSFLVGAYQFLLDWHRDWYLDDGAAKHKKQIYQGRGGQWFLTTTEKKRILLNNIFGVDIDSQAVEVTKLSLLLKVLEGENRENLENQLRLLHERALPDLGHNIKCGNSLIGPDFYSGKQMSLLDEEERYRINAFDWQAEFPSIFKGEDGGFDAVIGNPPYIRIQALKEWYPIEVEHYKRKYKTAAKGNYDVYVLFVERGLQLLSNRGCIGMILPHKFFNSDYGAPLRSLIATGKHLSHVVHFGHQQVFRGATTYTCLLFLSKRPADALRLVKAGNLSAWIAEGAGHTRDIQPQSVTGNTWHFSAGPGSELIDRLQAFPVKLGDVVDIFVGLQTSADDVFILPMLGESKQCFRVFSNALDREVKLEKDCLYPVVSGTDVKGYFPLSKRQLILFPYQVQAERATLLEFEEIKDRCPCVAEYLLRNKERLENRERGRFKGANWHRFGRSQNLGIQSRVKLCVPRLVERLHGGFDSTGEFFLDNVDVGGLTWKQGVKACAYEYLLGLMNSKLLKWYFPSISAPFRGGWRSANRQFLSLLPFEMPKKGDAGSQPSDIVDHVNEMLDLHARLSKTTTGHQNTILQRQINAAEEQIDQLVYELYGLTDKEIAIVEEATR